MRSVSTRRMYRRIPTGYRGSLFVHGFVQHVVVQDLSLNGLRIEGDLPPPCGSLVAVRIWLPDGMALDVDQAVVRWSNETQCGVQIISLSNEADFRLARHIECRLTRWSE
ncbi:MAG: PilZ domain-containing protein [Nitrospira sp.]|nr:PilZ domain-containing protein [Nitrospira sp.]MCP9441259.1 PilZ domain-containing protein [Nitrospira sp.]